jgi:hypothetical protein
MFGSNVIVFSRLFIMPSGRYRYVYNVNIIKLQKLLTTSEWTLFVL